MPTDTCAIRAPLLVTPLLVLASAALAPALGAEIVVNSAGDPLPAETDGSCALREAIQSANDDSSANGDCIDGAGSDEIVFDLPPPTTIEIDAAPDFGFIIDSDIAITGPGGAGVAVDGVGASRPFDVFFGASLTIDGLTIANGETGDGGGGIRSLGTLIVRNSTIRDNEAGSSGGGISVLAGTLTLENSTVSGNRAGISGGGIVNLNGLVARSSTIARNEAPAAGGLENFGTATIESTVLADSASGADCVGSGGTVTVANALIEDSNCAVVGSDLITGSDPMLGPLADNGGPTQGHLPAANSPLVDTGINVGGAATDQRGPGFARTADQPEVANGPGSDGTDIGSVERQLPPPPPAPPPAPPPPLAPGAAGPPGAPEAGSPVCNPVPERNASQKGTIRYTRTALKIQQNIDSAVIRRLNAANAWMDEGIVPTDLCAGAFGPGAFQAGISWAGGAPHTATPPTPRDIELITRPGTGTITKSIRQLRINENISRALRARAVATVKRMEALTGGNLVPGAILTARAVYPGLQAIGAKPASQDAPATQLEIGKLPKRIPIRPNASTVKRQQQRSQGSIILANRALDAITSGLTEENFVPGSIGSGRV